MNSDVMTKSATLEELIQTGREMLDESEKALQLEAKQREAANQTAEEATLALIREQLPDAVWPFLELGGYARPGGRILKISLPGCDTIWSTWWFPRRSAEDEKERPPSLGSDGYQLLEYRPGPEYPERQNERSFGSLEEVLAAANAQGPTFEYAEDFITEREQRRLQELPELDLNDRLQLALAIGDENGLGIDPQWRLTAVIAEALVSIAESQRRIAINSTEY